MLEVFDIQKSEFSTEYHASDDPFLRMEYDDRTGRLALSSRFFGTAYPVYLLIDGGKLYMSDSLISLKEAAGKKYRLNTDYLPFFFYNGFLPGTHTLIQGIHKLPPQKRVIVEGGRCRMESAAFSFSDTRNEGETLSEAYDRAFREALLRTLPDRTPINLALSGGYDSNLLLFFIKKMRPDDEVNCFSVGGLKGTDETDTAASIARTYDHVSFYSASVSPDTMNAFDDIVFRLQGCVYERGIFLQYELAKMLKAHNCEEMVCGECADQVFNSRSYKPLDDDISVFRFSKAPLEMASYAILKKNAVMLKSFGITGIYPYLDEAVVNIGAMTREENGPYKAFHKEQCERHLPPEIFGKIRKQGGSTQLFPLFDKERDFEMLCRESKYYDPTFRSVKSYEDKELVLDYYLSLLYIESFERQFCDEK